MLESEPKAPETVSGSVERVTYLNEENGYCVLKVKAQGKRELVTLVGHSAGIAAGEHFEARGEWSNHREFGIQFKASEILTSRPNTLDGIERYLGSGLVKGVGPHFAEKMVATFGANIFRVLEESPRELRRIPGIGAGRLKKIEQSWKEQKVVREIMVFLQSHGVGTARAVRIFKTYGESAVERVKEDPYRLARDVSGIGFKSADLIAEKMGIPRNSIQRARAGIHHVMAEKMGDGHCGFPEDGLIGATAQLLEVPPELVSRAVQEEVADFYCLREEVRGRTCLFSSAAQTAEKGVAEMLLALRNTPLPWGALELPKALSWAQTKLGLELEATQVEAVTEALRSKCLVITGGPGTGKTTLTRVITTILAAKNMRMALCSPTGRAARRLSECTGLEAKTIHRLLGVERIGRGFQHGRETPLEADLCLVDEVSMVDIFLLYNLLKALPRQAALILVGDADQLPSVGPGHVLGDLIESGAIPVVKLSHVFRQALTSRIVAGAHRIHRGEMPDLDAKDPACDLFFFPCSVPQQASELVVDLVKNRIPRRFGFDSIREVQVLCPMNRGGVGAVALGAALQKALNPNPTVTVERFGSVFAPGDKVMVTANDYEKEVFNGDIGFVTDIDKEDQVTHVEIEGRTIDFELGEMDILTPAYAITIHKSQGSEYPAVVIPLFLQHHMMLRRNLLYTGVTRGKKLVVIVGERRALTTAIQNGTENERWTRLAERLRTKAKSSATPELNC